MANLTAHKITVGGWYQRTTLHLSEVYGFFSQGFSKLELSKEKLSSLHSDLNLKEVTREAGMLEYVKAKTSGGIGIRYYEDGLYTLQLEGEDAKEAERLKDYLDNKLEPALSYIFSLGAPTPKILANIKTTHPIVVAVNADKPEKFEVNEEKFGRVYSKITSGKITVYKTPEYIFIVATKAEEPVVGDMVEMQIFFREFKDQLEKYLDIHRRIWEEISDIKERQFIKGRDVETIRTKLDSYQKTINLIDSRIKQMGAYVRTRASISKNLKIEDYLIDLFQYKFEVLSDTHEYIKEIWKMTGDYLTSAISIIKDIEGRSVNNSIKSLQTITAVGVVSGILGYMAKDSLPAITSAGIVYFILLLLLVWPLNMIIASIYKRQKYKLNFPKRAKNI